jgi:hypothetical protein
VSNTMRQGLAVVVAILAAYLILHVLRCAMITSEARGVCAGIVGYMVGDCIAWPRRRKR